MLEDQRAPSDLRDQAEQLCHDLLLEASREPLRFEAQFLAELDSISRQLADSHSRADFLEARGIFRSRTGNWTPALADFDDLLATQFKDAKVDGSLFLKSASELVNLGEYDAASARLRWLQKELAPTIDCSRVRLPDIPPDRALLSVHAAHLLTWILDYQGQHSLVETMSVGLLNHLPKDGGDPECQRLRGSIRHRWGRSLVERGRRLYKSGGARKAHSLIDRGAHLIRLGANDIEHVDRLAGRELNPYGPMWLTRASIAAGRTDARAKLEQQHDVAVERRELRPHVTLVEARLHRDLRERSTFRELEELDVAIDQWLQQRYRHGILELLLEKAEILKAHRDDPAALACYCSAHQLAEQLNSPELGQISRRLHVYRIKTKSQIDDAAAADIGRIAGAASSHVELLPLGDVVVTDRNQLRS